MDKYEFYFMNYIFVWKIVFEYVLFLVYFDLYLKMIIYFLSIDCKLNNCLIFNFLLIKLKFGEFFLIKVV